MPIVTKLTKQKRNKDYYNVFLDDKFAFSTHADIILYHGISKGKSLDAEEMKEIIEEDHKKRAFSQCLHYLSYRRRTQWELEEYLRKKEYSQDIIEQAVEKLKYYKMIDDPAYVKSYIADKKIGNPLGRKKLIFDLKKRGISDYLLENIDQWFSEEEEYEQAQRLVMKYHKKYSKLSFKEKLPKIYSAGQRRGFSWDILRTTTQELMKDQEDSQVEQIDQKANENAALAWGKKYKNRYEKRGFEGFVLKQKIAQAMMGRGYKWDLVEDVLGRILKND